MFRGLRDSAQGKNWVGLRWSLTPYPLDATTPSPRQRKDDFCLIIRQFSAVNSFLFVRQWKSGCDRCEFSWIIFCESDERERLKSNPFQVNGSGFRLCWRKPSRDDYPWVTSQRNGTSRMSPAQSGCSCLMFASHVFLSLLSFFISSLLWIHSSALVFLHSFSVRSLSPSINLSLKSP